MDTIEEITLMCLAPPDFLDKRDKQKKLSEQDELMVSRKDLKFYKKRILQHFKDTLNGAVQKKINNNKLDFMLYQYCDECVKMFKITDYHELQQAELAVFNELKSDGGLDDKTNECNDESIDSKSEGNLENTIGENYDELLH